MAVSSSTNWQSGRTLSQSASFMLDNQIATDVTFIFPNADEIVKAHRLFLMARSHVFYVMFNSDLDQPDEAVDISDIDPINFKEFLKYLYSDETTLSRENALHLTYCAEKYEVTDLKVKCSEFLQTQVDESNVAMVLDHAVLYNDDALIATCRDIIESLKSWRCFEECHVTKDTMELVLGLQDLAVREIDIYKFCNTWAEEECTIRYIPVNASNRRKMLGPLLRKIPFCSMTLQQFATEVSGKHLLNGQEEHQIFRYICAPDQSNPPFPCKAIVARKKPELFTKETTLQLSKKGCDGTNWRLKTPHIRHTGNLNCVAVSPDGSRCASGDKDSKVMLFHLLNNCECWSSVNFGSDCINALSFCPNGYWLCVASRHSIAIWLQYLSRWKLTTKHIRHNSTFCCMAISPDGSLCASSGDDGQAMLWDLSGGKHLFTFYADSTINALAFCPTRHQVCAATGPTIKIWNLSSKDMEVELGQEVIDSSSKTKQPECICLAWSKDGQSLYAGYSDNLIHVWQLS